MLTTVKYILITALRDKLFLGLFIAVFIAFGISIFLGGTALVEEGQMANVYIAGSTRIIMIVGLIVFVCFHVRTSFDNKEIELLLSRPISRSTFVFSYWLGFVIIALILVLSLALVLYFTRYVPDIGLMYWSISMFFECLLMVAFALFSALILRSAVTSVLLCFGFYIMSRMMGFLLYILDQPHLFKDMIGVIIKNLLTLVSWLMPRLDLYANTKWLVYSIENDISYQWFIYQTIVYVPFLLAMAILDFKRKQF